MRIDLSLTNFGDVSIECARAAGELEAMGFDGFWVSEHIVSTPHFRRRNYGTYWLESMSMLSHIAARTKKARLGIGVVVLPYRHPLLTAKAVATIDRLSGGRIDLGVGTGWSRQEYEALGLAHFFPLRGEVTNEILDILPLCWKGGTVNYEGKHFRFQNVEFDPIPIQSPLPFWVAAVQPSGAPLRRIVKYGSVWTATGMTPEAVKEMGDNVDQLAGRVIPRSAHIPIQAETTAAEVLDRIEAFRKAGCFHVRLDIATLSFPTYMKAAESLAAGMKPLQKAS